MSVNNLHLMLVWEGSLRLLGELGERTDDDIVNNPTAIIVRIEQLLVLR